MKVRDDEDNTGTFVSSDAAGAGARAAAAFTAAAAFVERSRLDASGGIVELVSAACLEKPRSVSVSWDVETPTGRRLRAPVLWSNRSGARRSAAAYRPALSYLT